jgi:hypothetical protein
MGFGSARKAAIQALSEGAFLHEARDALSEKNLLAVGDVTAQEVISLLHRTRGDQYSSSPHDWDPGTVVHVFRPIIDGARWYVKVYFLEKPTRTAVFISVHK